MTASKTRITPAPPAPCPNDLRPQIARVATLIEQEWDRLCHGLPPTAWEDGQRVWAAFQRALAAGHQEAAQAHLLRLAALLDAGATERQRMDRLVRLIEQYRRLVETHSRILRAAAVRLAPEDIGVLVEVMREAAARRIADPAVVAQIVAICKDQLLRLNIPPAPLGRHPHTHRSRSSR